MSSIEKAIERMGQSPGHDPKHSQNKRAAKGLSASDAGTAPDVVPDAKSAVHGEVECRLDLKRLAELGFITPDTGRTQMAEEFKLLKRPLLMNAFGKGAVDIEKGNLILVSSALPGEGKTYTSLNLAISMAMEMDTTVLLVDSDVIKPSMTKLLGLEDRPGLIDVLVDPGISLSDVIVSTDIPGLRVLPAGSKHLQSTELLASDQMLHISNELASRYSDRVVLFDAPPILATSEASVLASHVGQILLVVEAASTPQYSIKDAVSRLDKNKVIGTVLNKSRRSFSEGYGGYYGSYGG